MVGLNLGLGLGLIKNTSGQWYDAGKADNTNPSFWADYKNNRYATRKLASEVTSSNEVSLSRASTATYVDSAGIIRTAAIDTARVTYNPTTLVGIGLLTEAAETNEATNSELFSAGSGWSGSGINSFTKGSASPDGQSNATLMIENTAAASSHQISTPAIVIGSTYTISFFAKNYNPGGTSKRYIGIRGLGLGANFPVFDLELGTVTNSGTSWVAGKTKITPYINGWYRCEAVGIATTTGGPILNLLESPLGTPAYNGDGVSGIYLFGANYCQNGGNSATSYIPSFGSATTRAADLNVVITAMKARSFNDIHTLSRASTKTYIGSDGLLKTAAIDTPALTYDPVTRAPLGLSIEPAATNICLQSQNFADAAWTKDATNVTPNATTWIDGTTTMDLIVPDTSSANHRVKQTRTLTAGQVYTASVIVKRHSSYNYQLLFWNASGSGLVNVDMQNGTIQSTSGAELLYATLRNLGNGFYRVSVTILTVSGGSYQFMNYAISPSFVTVFAGDGTSGVYANGCQIELGYVASSYIPTTTSAVTRAQDVCVNNSGNVVPFANWYNTTANTILVNSTTRYNSGSGLPNSAAFCLNDNSVNNRSMLYRNANGAATGKMVVTSGGVDSFAQNTAGSVSFAQYKHAVAIAANDFALYEGGVQLGVDAAGALPVSPVQMGIGHCVVAGSPIDYLNGTIGEFRAYPARISNSELARIST